MKTALVLALLLSGATAASAQGLILPPDQAQLNAQTQQQLNNQNYQTQLNNLQTEQSNLQNQQRQQQLFNTLPPPAYMQNQFTPAPPASH